MNIRIADTDQRYRADLEAELVSAVGDSKLPLFDMIRYHLGWTDETGVRRPGRCGPMLRPRLCLLSCEVVGGDWHLALPGAASVELLHGFSLVHGDIEQGSEERRGLPAVWRVWGQPGAINAGDAMHTLARLTVLHLAARGVPPPKVIRAAALLDEACLRLCEGQSLGMSCEKRLDLCVDDYVAMISLRTASLFECSSRIGALIGTDDERVVERLGRFGRSLGLTCQIKDDISGVWGEDRVSGDLSAGDIARKRRTLPMVVGIERASAEDRRQLLGIYSGDAVDRDAIDSAVAILDRVGARQYAEDLARRWYEDAIDALEGVGITGTAGQELKSLAASAVERESWPADRDRTSHRTGGLPH